ncbi:MAG: DUF1080 domain-containing protein, partial [Planctomycetota bacterium]
WLPQGEIGNSPTSGVTVPESWGPYAGQMLHGDVTHGGVKRVFMENIDGVYQGAVFRFGQGMEAGTNRMVLGPDDALYVGGVGSNGNWQHSAAPYWFGLQKLDWTGDVPFEMLAIRPGNGGVELEFTQPLAEGELSPSSFRVRQFRYEPTKDYGGPKVDDRRLEVASVTANAERTKVWLQLGDADAMKPGHVIYVNLRDRGRDAVRSIDGAEPWTTEGWYTMNVMPDRRPDYAGEASAAFEVEDDFMLLFDGTDASMDANFRGFKRNFIPDAWQVKDGNLTLVRGGAGDLVTKQRFRDFDLRLQWNVSKGGNSGIMYRVAEEGDHTFATFATGPEMQVLDDERHGDARNGRDRMAGALYGLYAVPEPSPVNEAETWNDVRIVARGTQVQHYLNGELVVDVDMASDEWKQKIAASKFADWPRFAKESEGHIALQDHGDVVRYRHIRIKRLDD